MRMVSVVTVLMIYNVLLVIVDMNFLIVLVFVGVFLVMFVAWRDSVCCKISILYALVIIELVSWWMECECIDIELQFFDLWVEVSMVEIRCMLMCLVVEWGVVLRFDVTQ